MSPEQARGQEVDSRSDLYSWGALLYELVVGQPPYDGESALDVMLCHVQAPVPEISLELEQAMPGLGVVLRNLLSKSAKDRPASAERLRIQLDGLLSPPTRSLPDSVVTRGIHKGSGNQP